MNRFLITLSLLVCLFLIACGGTTPARSTVAHTSTPPSPTHPAAPAPSGSQTPAQMPSQVPSNPPTPAPPPPAPNHPTPVPFQVSSVDLSVTPDSIAGQACGTSMTFTYTAIFHIPAYSPGGLIRFEYSTDNGRGSTKADLLIGPGQTMNSYTFTSSGVLTPDNTYPGVGEVIVDYPNMVSSPQVKPSGACMS